MEENNFRIRDDNNRFDDRNYEKTLLENVENKINCITDKNRTRIETIFSFVTNTNNSDMRGSASIYALEGLYSDAIKHSE